VETLELPVGNTGICFGIHGKPLEMLELPVGKIGICFGINGKTVVTQRIIVLMMQKMLLLVKFPLFLFIFWIVCTVLIYFQPYDPDCSVREDYDCKFTFNRKTSLFR
jgi:hypothetical protein